MHASASSRFFSGTYVEARHRFLEAAARSGVAVETFRLEGKRGYLGEELATDVALIGRPDASDLVILSSGTHGTEGFAGSAPQLAAMEDEDIRRRLEQADVSLLLIHAVNPYGFSHLHRTNEDNIDLNRNFLDFGAPLPESPGYEELEAVLLPSEWPPSAENEAAYEELRKKLGERPFRAIMSGGQYISSRGLFYGGTAPSWSNGVIRGVLRKYACAAARISWIDVHTGLGPCGHGEKIYPGPLSDAPFAKSLWGADVMVIADRQSLAPGANGPMMKSIYRECPAAKSAIMAIEFGTYPSDKVQRALRADAWMRDQPHVVPSMRDEIRQQMRDVFYCDNDEWKGMVLGQSRTILLQSIVGLRAARS
jgi:hypothetical protein